MGLLSPLNIPKLIKRDLGLTQAYINGLWESREKPVSCFCNLTSSGGIPIFIYTIQIIEFVNLSNKLLGKLLLNSDFWDPRTSIWHTADSLLVEWTRGASGTPVTFLTAGKCLDSASCTSESSGFSGFHTWNPAFPYFKAQPLRGRDLSRCRRCWGRQRLAQAN